MLPQHWLLDRRGVCGLWTWGFLPLCFLTSGTRTQRICSAICRHIGTGTAEAAGQVCSQEGVLTVQDEMEEFMFLGLRMMQKEVREQEFARRFGQSVEAVYGSVLPRLLKEGLLIRDNGSIRLTRQGVSLSNYVMSEFIL